VSAWIRLVEPPTGQFRAFLHKGSADGKTRTPSVWLMPNDNRLSVRISTEKNADIGTHLDYLSYHHRAEWLTG
jgi:hypothetical protein